MDKNTTSKIEKEIITYKLNKIQKTESKVLEYQDVFDSISENIVIKFTKNATSNIIRVVFGIITTLLFLIGITFFLPDQYIELIEESGEIVSNTDKKDIRLLLPILGGVILFLAFLLNIISVLLKKNIKKRNSIYHLSTLLEEVIEYMGENVKEDKKRYEHFIDSITDNKPNNS